MIQRRRFLLEPSRIESASQAAEKRALERITYSDLHQQLLEQYAPPSVVVNEEYDIVHLSDRAGRYLHITGGDPSMNLLKVVREDLRLELRNALYQAIQRQTNVEAKNLTIHLEGHVETINISVRPVLRQDDTARGFILVLFEKTEDLTKQSEEVFTSPEPLFRQLEEELTRTKARLRTSTEQYEVQTEELKASNEELQAMNEELRSAAEELETSKEELQSINEELRTVNQELKVKIEEINLSSNNLQNIINSTDIGTIFLDRSFRVQLFTPAARAVFNLIPADFGRPLSDITNRLDYQNLSADAEMVLEKLQTVEREVRTLDGQFFMMRVLPYRTAEDRIDGVVLTFVDISRRKLAEEEYRQSEERLRLLIESAKDYAIFTTDAEHRITLWNSGAKLLFGYFENEIIGQFASKLSPPEDHQSVAERATDAACAQTDTARTNGHVANERWQLRKDGSRFCASGSVTALQDAGGKLISFVHILRDLTEQKQAEEALRNSHNQLEAQVQQRTQELVEKNNALIRQAALLQQQVDLLNLTYDAIVVRDAEDRIIFWSSGAAQLYGWTAEEAIGRKPDELWQTIFTEPVEFIHQVLRRDKHWEGELSQIRKDGSHIQVATRWVLQEGDGEQARTLQVNLDITQRKEAEAQREQLLRKLVETEEDERRHLSRELHDHLGQQLTALRLGIESVRSKVKEQPTLADPLQNLREIVRRLDQDVDFLARKLRPTALDDLGLVAAIANFVEDWSKQVSVPAQFHTSGLDQYHLTAEVESNLYRIMQEALTNVSKHAQATQAAVILERRDNQAVLIIEDNGIGFAVEHGGEVVLSEAAESRLGLVGMRERAMLIGGTLEIESSSGNGTTVFVRVLLSTAVRGNDYV